MSARYGLIAALIVTVAAPAVAAEPSAEIELRRLCDTIARGVRRLPGDSRYRRVTVAPFAGNDDDAPASDARRIVVDYLSVACLDALHDLAVVDPGAIFEDTDLGDPAAIAAVAAGHGLDVVVTGRLTRGPGAYTTSARVIAADSGEQYAALLHPLPVEATDTYTTGVLRPRTAAGAALRSAAYPGWGQLYNGETTQGVLFISTQTALLGVAAGFYIASGLAWSDYHADEAANVASKTDANTYEDRAAIALGLAGLVWAGSIIDAWIDGYRYDPDRAFEGRSRLTPAAGADWAGGAWTGRW